MLFNYGNYYRELDARTKKDIRTTEYATMLTNSVSSMFDFTELNETEKHFLMSILLTNGIAYVDKIDDKFLIMPVQYVGCPSKFGIFPEHIIGSKVTENDTILIDDNINNLHGGVLYCFPERLPLTTIDRYSYQLAEVDTSLVNNIQFSRIAPLVSSPYDNIRKSYEKAVKNMMNGELINSIMSVNSVIEGQSKSVDKVDISDGDYSEKIQYLSMYHTQLLSQFFNIFGIEYNFISKQANITNDELHCNETYCAIYPLNMKRNKILEEE